MKQNIRVHEAMHKDAFSTLKNKQELQERKMSESPL